MTVTKKIIDEEVKRAGYLDGLAKKHSLSELEQNKAEVHLLRRACPPRNETPRVVTAT